MPLKSLWEKHKLLLTNILSFSICMLHPSIPCREHFSCSCNKPFENVVGKGKCAGNENFLRFPCFLLYLGKIPPYKPFLSCGLQMLSRVTNCRLLQTERVCRRQFEV